MPKILGTVSFWSVLVISFHSFSVISVMTSLYHSSFILHCSLYILFQSSFILLNLWFLHLNYCWKCFTTSFLTSLSSVISIAFSNFLLLLTSTLSKTILLWCHFNRLLSTLFRFVVSSTNFFSIYSLISFSFSTFTSLFALSFNIFYYSFISVHHSFSYLSTNSRICVLYL